MAGHITQRNRIPGTPTYYCFNCPSLACGLLHTSDQLVGQASCVLHCADIGSDSIVGDYLCTVCGPSCKSIWVLLRPEGWRPTRSSFWLRGSHSRRAGSAPPKATVAPPTGADATQCTALLWFSVLWFTPVATSHTRTWPSHPTPRRAATFQAATQAFQHTNNLQSLVSVKTADQAKRPQYLLSLQVLNRAVVFAEQELVGEAGSDKAVAGRNHTERSQDPVTRRSSEGQATPETHCRCPASSCAD